MKRSKHQKIITTLCLVAPSIIGMFSCILATSGLTSAWFNTDVTYSKHLLIAASFEIETIVDNMGTKIDKIDGKYTLNEGTYDVSLTRAGESTSEGYIVLELGNDTYHTDSIEVGETITFKITTDTLLDLVITPKWGLSSNESTPKLENNREIVIDLVPDIPTTDEVTLETQTNDYE